MKYGKRIMATKDSPAGRHVATKQKQEREQTKRKKGVAATAAMLLVASLAPASLVLGAPANAAPVGAGFTLQKSDLDFILKQIKISEAHVASRTPENPCGTLLGTGPNQIPNDGPNGEVLPWGLRTVDGTCNNLVPGQENFGAADQPFPRKTPAQFRDAEAHVFDPDGPGPLTVGSPSSYADRQEGNVVVDSQPRVISNLIVDQTSANPAAVAAAGLPQLGPDGQPLPLPPAGETLPIGNVAPDAGLSAPFNSVFTLFGQFFDHGLDLVGKKGGTVFMPLKPDDPLYVEGSRTNFMVLTRAQLNEQGEAINLTTPFVDQNQTYTSHPSHQVFLREYASVDHDADATTPNRTQSTGRLIETDGGMATWADVKAQSADMLGIQLVDEDVLNVPLLATDPYGRFIPGPNGYPQIALQDGTSVEGDPAANGGLGVLVPDNAVRTGHAFLDDIAHNAVPGTSDPDGPNGPQPAVELTPDADTTITGATGTQEPGTYDNEMLDAHFIAGDGRANENIGLTSVHHIFHSEHNRLAEDITNLINAQGQAYMDEWSAVNPESGWGFGERLFQAARFVNEMEYQHLVFEEFGRKVQPAINAFGEGGTGYETVTNAAISSEFANAVYRFGHSMLTETVARKTPTGVNNDIGLIQAFLNPPAFREGTLTPDEAAGQVFRGMSRQVGSEIDEFVTEALRNNLLGLPLDLPTINIARARDTGVPTLNEARKVFYAESNNTQVAPYTSWADFGFNLKHEESLVNFVAAYGQHQTILDATTLADKRAAAEELVNPTPVAPVYPDGVDPVATPDDPAVIAANEAAAQATAEKNAAASAFMFSTGEWATQETGLNLVDLWVGGLAERQQVGGGLLGSTFNYVFEKQLEDLQFGDRFYYLSRTQGLNLLTQLEGNSFAELVMRNTDVSGLPADIFSRPDLVFNVPNLGPAGGPKVDDPLTEDVNEATLRSLVWMPATTTTPATLRFTGVEHVVFNGRDDADDSLWSSEGDDTMRGNGGNDRMQGDDGADNLIGGEGDDILEDSNGDDVLKGGAGNDALSSGQGFGLDLNQGGLGKDFIIGGNDITETFAGPGDDLVFAGDDLDTVFGDDGDDWIEGGFGPFNLLQGDSGQAFQNDPNGGHDVIDGNGGEQDYDAEGGDDVMLMGPGIQRAEGMLGFDWTTHKGDPSPANSDMAISGLLPPSINDLRDRFDLVEGLSGWDKNDVLRGDSAVEADRVGDPATTDDDHVLTAEGIARVEGLASLLPAGATSFAAGNIMLGGAGSDTIEGRGGDDIIDGDNWLDVRLAIDTDPDPNVVTLGTERFNSVKELQNQVFAGTLNPGDIQIVRRIISTPEDPAATHGTDVAQFTGAQNEYVVTQVSPGVFTVAHDGGAGVDGTDTLRNIEQVQFGAGAPIALADAQVSVPGAPTIGTATAGNASATVNWTAPTNVGSSPITEFQVQVFDGTTLVNTVEGIAASAASQVVTGLTNGTTYTFRVVAVNAAGSSEPSAASNAVTPQAAAPTVVDRSPAADATAVSVDANVTATFSQPVTNVSAASFQLRNAATNALVGRAVTYDPATLTATLNPNANLAPGTRYTATLIGTGANGIRTGTLRLATTSWSFTTTAAGDTGAPTVIATAPADGATNVNRGRNFTATFSERVVGVDGTTFQLRTGTDPNAGTVVGARVTLNGAGTVATLNPNGSLVRNTDYVLVLSGNIRDVAGNLLATKSWTFRTGR